MTPTQIVQAQVDAYNARNISDFINCHAPNIELFSFPENTPYANGRASLKEIYEDVFDNSPNLHAEINNRIVMGNTVIDHEKVTGRKGIDTLTIIAIYEIENGLIAKARFIRG